MRQETPAEKEMREWKESQDWYNQQSLKSPQTSSTYSSPTPSYQQTQSQNLTPSTTQRDQNSPYQFDAPPAHSLIKLPTKLTQVQRQEIAADLLQRHRQTLLNDEELNQFKNNARLSQGCAIAATGVVPWMLISMLSLKYNHALWSKHLKYSGACMVGIVLAFNVSLQQDVSFFDRMRSKYFSELTDEQIVNFDEQTRNLVAQRFRLTGQNYYQPQMYPPQQQPQLIQNQAQIQQQFGYDQQQPQYGQQQIQPQYGQPQYGSPQYDLTQSQQQYGQSQQIYQQWNNPSAAQQLNSSSPYFDNVQQDQKQWLNENNYKQK